jgi:spore maturation protein A
MLNAIWLILLVVSAVVALLTGNMKQLVTAVTDSAGNAVKLAIGLTGVMALWLGMMKIAEQSGLILLLTRMIAPSLRVLFPKIPAEHPSLGSMAMNMSANVFGLSNAATPLGIKAMEDLDGLNKVKGTASDEMCMFLAINTSSIQLVPAGAISLLAAGGSTDPTSILAPALIATTVSTICGVLAAQFFSRLKRFAVESDESSEE